MLLLHTVRMGETLYSIASSYGISVAQLMADNYIPFPEKPVIGQELIILIPEDSYTVTEGDTLFSVSQKTGVPLRALLRNNPFLTENSVLYSGQTLVLRYGPLQNPIISGGYAYPFIAEDALSYALPYLSDIIVFTYGFDNDGNLISPAVSDLRLLEEAKKIGSSPVLLLSTLGSDGTFNSNLPNALFDSSAAFDRLVSSLLDTMAEKGYTGLEVDFEYIPKERKEDYSDFIAKLTDIMNENGYPVTVALAPKTDQNQPGLLYEAHDYEALGKAANRVLLMTYEWGYTYGPPRPVAPIDKVSEVLRYALSVIPPEKILLGIPGYGYDWTLPYTQGTAARSLSPNEAIALAADFGAEILFDPVSLSPYFYYTDPDGNAHIVHFEDARSYKEKLELIAQNGLSGFSLWTAMKELPQLFLVANALYTLQ